MTSRKRKKTTTPATVDPPSSTDEPEPLADVPPELLDLTLAVSFPDRKTPVLVRVSRFVLASVSVVWKKDLTTFKNKRPRKVKNKRPRKVEARLPLEALPDTTPDMYRFFFQSIHVGALRVHDDSADDEDDATVKMLRKALPKSEDPVAFWRGILDMAQYWELPKRTFLAWTFDLLGDDHELGALQLIRRFRGELSSANLRRLQQRYPDGGRLPLVTPGMFRHLQLGEHEENAMSWICENLLEHKYEEDELEGFRTIVNSHEDDVSSCYTYNVIFPLALRYPVVARVFADMIEGHNVREENNLQLKRTFVLTTESQTCWFMGLPFVLQRRNGQMLAFMDKTSKIVPKTWRPSRGEESLIVNSHPNRTMKEWFQTDTDHPIVLLGASLSFPQPMPFYYSRE
jgi:hypothetical protein